MKLTRRDLFTWSAGVSAGLLFTPVPWKVLDDASIWTQNWPSIPQPARGPVEVKPSFCNLCPNGCGMRVRLAAGWPVGISGMPHHPVTQGALCPLGFGAHQLNWHPQRLRQVRHHGTASSWNDALAAFRKAVESGPIAVIDGYPGRAASAVLRSFTQKHGSYAVIPSAEEKALGPYETWTGVPAAVLGYDLEHAGTIVSFGAPLLDGWGAPGQFTRLWSERAASFEDPPLRLIQVEPAQSHTAACAWRWVMAKPGSEPALAAGLARVLLEEHLVPAKVPLPETTLAESAAKTALSVDAIRDLARTLVAHGPALAIAVDAQPAVAALNVVLGAVGARGGIVRRNQQVASHRRADSLTGPFSAVLIDSSVPWDYQPPAGIEVFRFAAWDGGTGRADWQLPARGFLEELTDIPSAPTSPVETYALAAALAPAPAGVQSAAQFLVQVDPTLTPVDRVIHQRCQELFRARTGRLQGGARVESAEALEKALWNGAIWVGDPPHTAGLHSRLEAWPAVSAAPCPANWAAAWIPPVLPPLAEKLYQESSLREPPAGRRV